MSSPGPVSAKDLLLADLEHFGQSLWRNEELGERRLTFFLTLITAATAGLVAAHTADAEFEQLDNVTNGALAALAIFGLVTYFRMLRRNIVTDQYKATLSYLRHRYWREVAGSAAPYEVPQPEPRSWSRAFHGGLADTAAAVTSILFTALLVRLQPLVPLPPQVPAEVLPATAIVIGGALFVVLCVAARRSRGGDGAQYFRASVGAVICDGDRVLALDRRDLREPAWQLPQGGLEPGEEPEQAVWREIEEETGLTQRDLEIIDRLPSLLAYELPEAARSRKTGRGQTQYWFFFRMRSASANIALGHSGEFSAYQWITFQALLSRTVDFRLPVYERLAEYSAAGNA